MRRRGIKNLLPCVLSSRDVGLAVEGNVGEGIAVEELNSPVKDANEATKDAEKDRANQITLGGILLLSDGTELAQAVDDGNNKTAKADTSKAIGYRALESSPGRALWHVVRAKVPGAIDSRNGRVNGVLEPLRDPVRCECDEDKQANDFSLAASSSTSAARRIAAWLVLDVHGD